MEDILQKTCVKLDQTAANAEKDPRVEELQTSFINQSKLNESLLKKRILERLEY